MQLTISDAARAFHVTGATVHRWIRERGLPAVRFNEQLRLNQVDLVVWAQVHSQPLDADALPAQIGGAPDLAAALRRGGIHRDVVASDRATALRAAVQHLPLGPDDRAVLQDVLAARPAHDGTAIGEGIAIPHARHPIVLTGGESLLSLCFLRAGVPFGAADGQPVHTLFTLVTPTVRVHLRALAQLARALHGDFGRRVADRATDAELLAALATVARRQCEADPPPEGGA